MEKTGRSGGWRSATLAAFCRRFGEPPPTSFSEDPRPMSALASSFASCSGKRVMGRVMRGEGGREGGRKGKGEGEGGREGEWGGA